MTSHSSENHKPELSRLDTLRDEVDGFDRQILALVVGRTSLALEIADAKQALNLPTMVSGRHAEVVENYQTNLPEDGPLTPEDAVALCEVIMKISRDAQDRRRFNPAELSVGAMKPSSEAMPDPTH